MKSKPTASTVSFTAISSDGCFNAGELARVQFVNDRKRNSQRIVTHVVEVEIVLLKIESERGRDYEKPSAHARAEHLVQTLNRILIHTHTKLLLMIEHQYAATFEVAVQRHAAN